MMSLLCDNSINRSESSIRVGNQYAECEKQQLQKDVPQVISYRERLVRELFGSDFLYGFCISFCSAHRLYRGTLQRPVKKLGISAQNSLVGNHGHSLRGRHDFERVSRTAENTRSGSSNNGDPGEHPCLVHLSGSAFVSLVLTVVAMLYALLVVVLLASPPP